MSKENEDPIPSGWIQAIIDNVEVVLALARFRSDEKLVLSLENLAKDLETLRLNVSKEE